MSPRSLSSEGEMMDLDENPAKAHDTAKQRSKYENSVNKKLRDALTPSPPPPTARPGSSRGNLAGGTGFGNRSRRSSTESGTTGNAYRQRRSSDESYGGHKRHKSKGFDGHYRHGRNKSSRNETYYPSSSRDLPYDDRDNHRHKRRRSRSRSPVSKDDMRRRNAASHQNGHSRGPSHNSSKQSRDPEDRIESLYHSTNKEVRSKQNETKPQEIEMNTQQTKNSDPAGNSSSKESVTRPVGILKITDHPKSSDHDQNGDKSKVTFASDVKDEAEAPVAQSKPEAISIEERRRRREAIKAKYKSAASPLAVQVLEQNLASENATPTVSPGISNSATPIPQGSPSSPGTPENMTEDPDFEGLTKEVDTTNVTDVQGPSAADYDPTNDRNEDRLRHERHQEQQETKAEDYDETKANDRDPSIKRPAGQAKPEKKDIDDMFASDDDDDMFAVGPDKVPDQKSTVQAKTLDQSMLDNWDDDEGYYRIILGELLDGRYQVQTTLGKGVFSSVIRAHDKNANNVVAIKVIRNNETMTKAGAVEIGFLKKLMEADPEDKKHLIRLERSFTHKNHLCMVFENLSFNLREILKKYGREVGINSQAVRSYAQQMFLGLSLMRKCGILHADLKPDNMLVTGSNNKHLKICDLGSAEDANDAQPNTDNVYLVSRFYRAPEIILGIPYDYAIDMWSVGCTLYELWTGKILFNGRDNNQMLRCIMECRGKFSLKMLKKAEHAHLHFENDVDLTFRSMETDRITKKPVTRKLTFAKPVQDLKSKLFAAAPKGISSVEAKELNLFVDLLDRCLALNPERRITPADALKHPFFKPAGPAPAK